MAAAPDLVKRASFTAPWLSEIDCSAFAAVKEGNLSALEQCLDKGASLAARGPDSETFLHVASYNGHIDCVQMLIDRGAAINLNEKFRGTPLHIAAFAGHENVVRLLLEHGALPTAKSTKGRLAHEVASTPEIADMILAAKKLRKTQRGSRRSSLGVTLPAVEPLPAFSALTPAAEPGGRPDLVDGRVVKRGFLLRQGRFKRLKQRLILVETKGTHTKLSWFKSTAHAEPLGLFRLRQAVVRPVTDLANVGYAFTLRSDSRFQIPGEPSQHLFIAQSMSDRSDWIRVLNECIAFANKAAQAKNSLPSSAPSPVISRRNIRPDKTLGSDLVIDWRFTQTSITVAVDFQLPPTVPESAVKVKVHDKWIDISLAGLARPVLTGPLFAAVAPPLTDTQVRDGHVTVTLRKLDPSVEWPALSAPVVTGSSSAAKNGNDNLVDDEERNDGDDEDDSDQWSASESDEAVAEAAAAEETVAPLPAPGYKKKASSSGSKLAALVAKKRQEESFESQKKTKKEKKKKKKSKSGEKDEDEDDSFEAFVSSRTSTPVLTSSASELSQSTDLLSLSDPFDPFSAPVSSSSPKQRHSMIVPPSNSQMASQPFQQNTSPFAAAPMNQKAPRPASTSVMSFGAFNPFEQVEETSTAKSNANNLWSPF